MVREPWPLSPRTLSHGVSLEAVVSHCILDATVARLNGDHIFETSVNGQVP